MYWSEFLSCIECLELGIVFEVLYDIYECVSSNGNQSLLGFMYRGINIFTSNVLRC
jgi:hypothetical protein